MSEYALHAVFTDPEQAKQVIARAIGPYCRAQWQNGHGRLAVTIEPEEDAKTVQQGRFLWGVVYHEIAHQANVGGIRYTSDAWHCLFKRMYLPRKKIVEQVAGRKRPVVYTTIGTTKGMTVKAMSKYIEQVIAYAVNDLNVKFSETRWENHR